MSCRERRVIETEKDRLNEPGRMRAPGWGGAGGGGGLGWKNRHSLLNPKGWNMSESFNPDTLPYRKPKRLEEPFVASGGVFRRVRLEARIVGLFEGRCREKLCQPESRTLNFPTPTCKRLPTP